ncbi:MAG: hypothetical protein WCQ99_15285 [Pseudomonadota bacterium]
MSMDRELYKGISEAIEKNRPTLANKAVEIQYDKFPESLAPYGARGKLKSLEDAEYNLKYLAEAIALGDQLLFTNHILWLNNILTGVKVPPVILFDHLKILKEECIKEFPPAFSSITSAYLEHALNALEGT